MILGLVLIFIGLIALAIKMGLLPGSIWSNLWPVVLIIVGLAFLVRRGRRGSWCCGSWRARPGDKEK